MSIRLVIADDHEVIRAGLTGMLAETEVAIVGMATNGAEALELALSLHPDAVLLDVRMPDVDGLSCLSRLRSERPSLPVLMFSNYDSLTYVARAVALGASGYLLKSATRDELLSALRAAAKGETIWTRDELRRVSGTLTKAPSATDCETPLTKREGEVLKQLALGLTNKEIALALSISYETVKEHVQHILRKIGVSDRTQAAVWAVRNGLV